MTVCIYFSVPGFSNDNMTIEFTPAVEYEHISISQVIDGILVETRGEVGLLTHNVKIRGSVHEEWLEEVEACPDEFDTSKSHGLWYTTTMHCVQITSLLSRF